MIIVESIQKFCRRKFLGQNGVGLVGVMAAAAMVVVIALVVAQFITSQTKQSTNLEFKSSCENIANSIVEYIKKDESSLFISSYGPPPGQIRFASGLDKTVDGLDRYAFGRAGTPLFTGSGSMSLPNGKQSLPGNWKYFNHLNIKNSTNRLLALAANGNFCCASMNMNDPNCGSVFLDDSMTRSALHIPEKNVEINLAVNFKNPDGSSMCSGQRLSLSNLPDSSYNRPTDFKVKVTMKGAGGGKVCIAGGNVTPNTDTTPPLTLIEMQGRTALCATGKKGLPSHCNAATPVVFKLKTVKNSTGTSCVSQCLSQVQSKTCDSLGVINLFNTFSQTACMSNCLESEPGSSYLCKIGEKNWFKNNPNHWEPCEQTKVYDWDGKNAGNAVIEYKPVYNGSRSEVTTNATLTLSNLAQGRAYVVDIRAIDTKGNIGPSFCSTNPSSCSDASDPQFVVIPSAPIVGDIVDSTHRVAPTTDTSQLGRVNAVTSQPKYATALSPFGANQYQCENGAPKFSVPVSYSVPAGAYPGFVTNSCTSTLKLPDGTVQSPNCICSGANCSTQLPASVNNGQYEFRMNIVNDCGGTGTVRSQDWCKDGNTAIGISNSGNKVFGITPDFETHVNYPTTATKACGIVSLCPNVNGGFTPTIGACKNSSIGWNPLQHSGCLQAPGDNYCMLAMDPCGRSQNTSPVAYSTRLVGVPSATNFCFKYGSYQVGGNSCEAGSYCNSSGKCTTGCGTPPCPTNASTPTTINCGPKYCPTLNSCTISIGSASSTTTCSAGGTNGACGSSDGGTFASAPTTGLCSAGTASAVLPAGAGPWSWTCNGTSGGTNATCNANTTGPCIDKTPTLAMSLDFRGKRGGHNDTRRPDYLAQSWANGATGYTSGSVTPPYFLKIDYTITYNGQTSSTELSCVAAAGATDYTSSSCSISEPVNVGGGRFVINGNGSLGSCQPGSCTSEAEASIYLSNPAPGCSRP